MEPFGHFSAAARVFCESEEGNICAHPSEVEGNGKTWQKHEDMKQKHA